MNTPNYILQRNNQTVINLRPIHERMGFTPAEFPSWFKDRIRKMNLTEGKDFEKFSENRHFQYIVPVKVALSILNTVPAAKAAPIKKEIAETLAASTPLDVENKPVEMPEQKTLPLFVSEPTTPAVVKLAGPVGVMQIEGRAAVDAEDLFALWNTEGKTPLKRWLAYRIAKLGLTLGKNYVEYSKPDLIRRKPEPAYIVSIDTAIAIADSETKGRGKAVSEYLTRYRKDLAKQRLSTKGKLSEFIGMQPLNVAAFETRDVLEDSCSDTFEVSGLGGGPELINTQPCENSGDGLFAQNGKNSTDGINDTNVNKSDEEVSPETVENPNTAPDEVFSKNGNNPEELQQEREPNLFDLMVKFAQGLLQQSQGMAELYRQMLATSGTVSELVKIEQQAALRKLGLYPGKAAIPAMTLRDKINHAVNKRNAITGEKHEDIFKAIYARLANDYGYSVLDFERKKGQSHLQLCEELGIISIVWDIVNGAAFNRYVTATPKATA
jgi:phage anti-repressor protein